MMPRHAAVAVTGIGAISPYGLGWEVLLEGLSQCRSGIAPISASANPLDSVPVVGQVTVPLDVEAPTGFRLSRTDRLALLAAREASVPLNERPDDRRECAVVVSTTVAGLSDIDAACVSDPAAYYRRGGLGPASTYPVSHVADSVAAKLGLRGPRLGISVACASGAMAIGVAARLIEEGRVRVALAGGSDALAPITLAGFNALQALDDQPCRPFCQTRAGLNLGEGAAMLLLEDAGHARARGAVVLGWLSGWAFSNDAFHPTAPDEGGRGLALSMERAMRSAGVRVEEVGYVNAHGTGTHLNDAAEVKALERVFAGRTAPVPVSSTKSHIGHTLGAAGAIEAVITLLALRTGTLFPTLRLDQPIESGSVDLLKSSLRHSSIDVAMSVSAGFGGSNASLVFELARDARN
jgi:3-oxoacyl-[acyl-carrier-protein] synthase II